MKTSRVLFYIQSLPINPFHLNLTHWTFKLICYFKLYLKLKLYVFSFLINCYPELTCISAQCLHMIISCVKYSLSLSIIQLESMFCTDVEWWCSNMDFKIFYPCLLNRNDLLTDCKFLFLDFLPRISPKYYLFLLSPMFSPTKQFLRIRWDRLYYPDENSCASFQ